MKKLFVLLMAFLASGLFAQANGIIRELSGEVELKPAGASSFTPAQEGSIIAADTIVSTGFKGTAIIELGSSLITVRPLTRLTLSEIQTAAGVENVTMNLQAGRVRVDVTVPAGTRTDFTVQSPSATASVRGTRFEFDSRNLKVYEGTVSFRGNSGLSTLVHAGSSSHIEGRGKVVDPVTVANGELLPPPPVGGSDLTGSMADPRTILTSGELPVTITY